MIYISFIQYLIKCKKVIIRSLRVYWSNKEISKFGFQSQTYPNCLNKKAEGNNKEIKTECKGCS